jgi:polyisoprenyl-phosphate glycosyltransferase
MKTFSIVVPVYQNEGNLHTTVPRLLALRDRIGALRLELVFVDDGSTDGSYAILSEYARQHADTIVTVKLTRNFGQTPATQAGLAHASGDCVGIISADLQEPETVFIDMLRHWEKGAKFVIGERRTREESRSHQAVSSIYWNLVRRLALPDFPDLGYDFCLLDRQLVDEVVRINEKNSSIFVLLFWFGHRPVRVPIVRSRRTRGRSQWTLSGKIRFTLDTLIGFTHVPARVIVISSFVAAVLSLAYLAFLLVVWTRSHAAPPGWMTLAGLSFLGGALILFSLGIIAEYLLRILDEARKRPLYVVEQIARRGDSAESAGRASNTSHARGACADAGSPTRNSPW